MTERKPAGMSYTSWIDQQIETARERGAFDNLPGAGKPLRRPEGPDDGQSWIREYARREGVSAEEMLPTPLRLRKQAARLAETIPDLGSEQEVRDAVYEVNKQIVEWRRIPLGPAIFVPLVDLDAMLASWRAAHPGAALARQPEDAVSPGTPAVPAAAAEGEAERGQARWRRLFRGRPGPA